MALTDWIVALKETTLATGASVPMTKAEPVLSGFVLDCVVGHAAADEQK